MAITAHTFFSAVKENSLPLLTGILIALIWINTAPNSYNYLFGTDSNEKHFKFFDEEVFGYDATITFLINDGFMVFFFSMAAKGITEALHPGGSLNPIRKAICPVLATLGGILGPIVVFFVVANIQISSGAYAYSNETVLNGWGVPTATDISLAWVAAKAVFGAKSPAIDFLLLLAIVDDGIGLIIIAVFYPDPTRPVQPIWLLLTLAGVFAAFLLRRFAKVGFWPFYVSGPGLCSWIGLMKSGIHPALALVPIVPFIPMQSCQQSSSIQQKLGSRLPEKLRGANQLQSYEDSISTFVTFGMFFFGLANAGVRLNEFGHMTICIMLCLMVGKPLGISAVIFVVSFFGPNYSSGLSTRDTLMLSSIGGLGLTVALFVAGVAFPEAPSLRGQAKLGALAAAALTGPFCVGFGRLMETQGNGFKKPPLQTTAAGSSKKKENLSEKGSAAAK